MDTAEKNNSDYLKSKEKGEEKQMSYDSMLDSIESKKRKQI